MGSEIIKGVSGGSSSDQSDWATSFRKWARKGGAGLWLWGPLAPAHDAVFARKLLTGVQTVFGVYLLRNAFKVARMPRPTRLPVFANVFAGVLLFSCSAFEVIDGYGMFYTASYIEASVARRKAEEKGEFVPYWSGPADFMPSKLSENTSRDSRYLKRVVDNWEYWEGKSKAAKQFDQAVTAQALLVSPWKRALDDPVADTSKLTKLLNPGVGLGKPASQVLDDFFGASRLEIGEGVLDTDNGQFESAWTMVELVQNLRFAQFLGQREAAIFYPVTVTEEEESES